MNQPEVILVNGNGYLLFLGWGSRKAGDKKSGEKERYKQMIFHFSGSCVRDKPVEIRLEAN
jgi:hypothetical protein